MSKRTIKERGKVFRDPVHRLIRIQPDDIYILELIDTPVFQRLRRIRQLGVSWMTYHGAEHSRFSHSMGVFNFAQRILAALKERYVKQSKLIMYLVEHEKELKAAALLHDIGHTPFSHMLERAFGHSIKHEDKTKELILDETGGVWKILKDADIDPRKVAEITQGSTSDSKHRLIIDIVSSQLDADRMDYLLRDSLHTGVEYGTYDAEWLIRNLCIGRDPHSHQKIAEGDFTQHRLCLDRDRGVQTAEQLIMARLHMTVQVYMHRVTRGYETLLLNLFRLAATLAKDDKLPSGTPAIVNAYFANDGMLRSEEEWLRFDEMAMFTALSAWANNGDIDKTLQRMASAFLFRKRIVKGRELQEKDRKPAKIGTIMKLTTALGDVAKQHIDWDIDDGSVMPYKGLRYEATRTGNDAAEEQSAESILLSSGEPDDQAVAIDTVSDVLKTLDYSAQPISRIYYGGGKSARIEECLCTCGIPA